MIIRSKYLLAIGKSLFILGFLSFISCNFSDPESEKFSNEFDLQIKEAQKTIDIRKPEKAIRFIDSSFYQITSPNTGDKWKRFNFISQANYNIARLNYDSSRLKKANVFIDSAILLVEKHERANKYAYELCMSYFTKGDILFELKNYHEAYKFYYKGKLLADDQLSKCDQGVFQNRFALLNYKQKSFAAAASLFMKAYQDYSTCSFSFTNFMILQGALSNAGMSYAQINKLDSAQNCYQKGLALLDTYNGISPNEKRDILDAKGVFYYNLGELNMLSGKKAKAAAYFEKSVKLNETFGKEQRHAQTTKIQLARANFDLGNWDKSRKILAQIRIGLDTLPNTKAEEEWQLLMYNFSEINNLKKEAETHLINYLNLEEKRNKQEANLILTNAEQEFYALQREYELSLLQKDKTLSNVYLIFTSSVALLCLLFIVFLYRNIKSSRKTNVILNDVNKKMFQQNEYLHKTLKSLEDSHEENTRVMQIITHDLRSPMAAIVGLSGFMIAEHNLSEEDMEVISLINTSGSDSLKFINDILKKESDSTGLKTEPVDLDELLTYCTTQLQYKAKDKNQSIVFDGSPITLALNREQIWRVMSNLINNAIKFSLPDSIINVSLQTNVEKVIITVKDNGVGIPDHLKDRIFTASEDIKREGTSGEQSYGLGLSISKQIIEAHGGQLTFESIENVGTSFFIIFPNDNLEALNEG